MITIIFESHRTTVDNEAHVSSGHADVALSELGIRQSKELGERRGDEQFDAIFCSDLQRSFKTAELAFGEKFPIVTNARLRECDYGDLTQHDSEAVNGQKAERVSVPYPHGESYQDCMVRMKPFLRDLKRDYDGNRVMIIGHRATQYGLEHWIKLMPVEEVVTAPWQWQPGVGICIIRWLGGCNSGCG